MKVFCMVNNCGYTKPEPHCKHESPKSSKHADFRLFIVNSYITQMCRICDSYLSSAENNRTFMLHAFENP